jgi:peptidoglycan/xylan/chitin deacetylase (PgdA/CDA1 family)
MRRPSFTERGIRSAIKIAAATADAVRPPPNGVVILLYHRVGASTDSLVDLPASAFERQMAALAATGRVGTLDDALTVLRGEKTGPSIAVTFDDGTADLADVALPILVRHRIPSTWYLATSFVDDGLPMTTGATPLSWSAVRDACSTGLVSIGSHTHRHRLLDRVARDVTVDELDRSISSITEQVGSRPEHFAYPKGLLGSPEAESEVRLRFRSAALAGTRANVIHQTDVHRLARSPIQTNDTDRWFSRKMDGGLHAEDTVRTVLNRVRHARAST